MKAEYFDKLLHGNNGIKISDEWNIFNDYELYNFKTNESKQYKNLDELLKDNPSVAKIIEESDAFYLDWSGGRGSGSGGKAKMGGGFSSAKEQGGGKNERLLPAELNYGESKGNSVDAVLGRFQSKYGYNDGADWWLKANQKKYGYTYTSKGMKNAGKDAGW